MKIKIVLSHFLSFLFLSGSVYASKNELTVITVDAPPYSYFQDDEQKGFATVTIKKILKKLKINSSIHQHPTKRASVEAKKSNTLVYPLTRNSVNENQFYWIGKISGETIYLYKHKSRTDIQLTSIKDALNYSVGVVRGATANDRLAALDFNKIEKVSEEYQNLIKSAKSRIDLFASDELILAHIIETYNKSIAGEKKIKFEEYERVLPLPAGNNEDGLYIALSRGTPLDMVKKCRKAFQQIKQAGALLEVAHWWTNSVEQSFVDIFKKRVMKEGYQWVDYAFEGGAGTNMRRLLEIRDQNVHRPHAMQTYMGPATWHWADKNILIDLNQVAKDQDWENCLPPLLNQMVKYNGNYVAVPVNIQRVNWVWINSVVFDRSNAKIPETWDEFFEAADKIQSADFIPVSIGLEAWQEGTLFENMVLGMGGPEFYRNAFISLEPNVLNSPKMIEVLTDFKRVRQYINDDASSRSWTSAAQLVADGKAAMYFMGDWAKAVFKQSDQSFKKGTICIPTPGTDGIFLNNTDVFVFPLIDVSNIPAQRALAKIIMDREIQENFNILKGSIPARTDISMKKFDQIAKFSMRSILKDEIVPSFNFRQTAPETVHESITRIISRFFNSNMPPEDAAKFFADIVIKRSKEANSFNWSEVK